MTCCLITHPACWEHDTGAHHPERPERLDAIEKALTDPEFQNLERLEAPEGEIAAITRAHSPSHVDHIRNSRPERGLAYLDGDTPMSPGSWEAALRAVGAAQKGVDLIMTGDARTGFCAVRPPGHHAEKARAMGFCLFNNVAIAAFHARDVHGAERIAVVDFDVHHGNGTQDIFWEHRDLFYASTHQMPLYPGTGRVTETGVANNIVNAPLPANSGSDAFRDAMRTRILPALKDFAPDLILISAGFDAHRADPLASLALEEEDFHWVTLKLADIAHDTAEGRMLSFLEGGYDLDALASSAAAHVSALQEAAS